DRIIQGDKVSLFEFPIAPLNKDTFAVLQNCQAPELVKENILCMFADGMNPPFQAQSFDTVLTPWLIDIVPQNLRDLVPRINRILRKGGRWVNTGSLAFLHQDPSWCYSEEEVLELLEKNGFEVTKSNRKDIQYLKSPISAHGRIEKVFNFCAKKVRDAVVPSKYDYLPKWILDTNKSIPKHNEYEFQSSKYLLQAQVMGAVDGDRSIEQIGALVAQQYALDVNEATHAVRRILIDWYEGNSN
ncbi:MAG: methyltransferase domain-containing protein, partial [Gammaproteobacteria bacterium]